MNAFKKNKINLAEKLDNLEKNLILNNSNNTPT